MLTPEEQAIVDQFSSDVAAMKEALEELTLLRKIVHHLLWTKNSKYSDPELHGDLEELLEKLKTTYPNFKDD